MRLFWSACGAFALALAQPAAAQNFPAAPVKIVVSLGPGTDPDAITRLIGDRLSRLWSQQVVVLNHPGGSGAIAIKVASTAMADGTTLFMALSSHFIALPHLFPTDLLRDFKPIGLIGELPLTIGAAPSLGVGTLPELIALLKQRPGELNIGAGTFGGFLHLTAERLRSATGTKFTLVHYVAGGPQALPDLIGGRLQAMIDTTASMGSAIEGGLVKPLAVTTKKRIATFPQVPAAAETIPDFEAVAWMLLMAPPGTPETVVRKVSDDLRAILTEAELQKRLEVLGNYTRPTTLAELPAFIREQQRIWAPVIDETAKSRTAN
jgi:tripartite-type tricarboxylate transporter receptor subunit TctC